MRDQTMARLVPRSEAPPTGRRLDLEAILPPHLRPHLEAAIASALRTGAGDAAVDHWIRNLHLAEADHRLLRLAYSLWRGFGPALEIQSLWGMDRPLLLRLLAGLATASAGREASDILRDAADLADKVADRMQPASRDPVRLVQPFAGGSK